jgi:hypothetical protein
MAFGLARLFGILNGLRNLEWLFKGDGSQLDPVNYRLLAISSVVSKLFEKILESRIQAWSERVGLLSDLQGGFRARWTSCLSE